jgi:hypothetical protein
MKSKLNCWEYRKCGREKGGLMVDILGECPVASAMKFDGRNDGIAAGRACWMVSGGGCAIRLRHDRSNCCLNCEFYQRVMFEQEENVSYRFATETA